MPTISEAARSFYFYITSQYELPQYSHVDRDQLMQKCAATQWQLSSSLGSMVPKSFVDVTAGQAMNRAILSRAGEEFHILPWRGGHQMLPARETALVDARRRPRLSLHLGLYPRLLHANPSGAARIGRVAWGWLGNPTGRHIE